MFTIDFPYIVLYNIRGYKYQKYTLIANCPLSANFHKKGGLGMKKYMTPELKALAFVAKEAISLNDLGGNLSDNGDANNAYNDAGFGQLNG